MAADEWKNEEACKLADVSQSEGDRKKYERKMSKFKERTEEPRKQKVQERGEVHKLFVFEEDEEECKVLMTERSLRRGSEEVVKMQDRRQRNPKNNDLT